jgi:hypothetical protein
MTIAIDLRRLAKALDGDICNGQILAPGPGHSAVDRSLSVRLDPKAPEGFVVHSFSGNDPLQCRDYVRQKAGLPPIEPKHLRSARTSSSDIQRTLMAAVKAQTREGPKATIVRTYDYTEADGALLYQVCRMKPKSFRQRRPDGKGGWIWEAGERRVLYRLPELLAYPDGTVFVTEGEKDADGLTERGLCATTVASGKWTDDCIQALRDRDIMVLEDNDDAGRAKALTAAQLLHSAANSLRIIRLPGLPEHGDVSDWFDQDCRRTTDQLINFCFDQSLFSLDSATGPKQPAAAEETPARAPTATGQAKPNTKQPEILRYHRHRDANDPAPKYLVKNLLPETGVGLISGQWGTYKTFIALKLAGAIAMGQPFAGYTIKRQGAILYLAWEGASELPVRLEALSTVEHGGSVLPIYYCSAGVRLLDQSSVASIIATAKQVEADARRDHKLPLVLIVIDTVISAAAFAKTGDENDSTVGAQLMAALSMISQATGTFVLGIDHFGKVAETGTRGTSAKEDAADVVLALLATKSISGEVTNSRLCVRKRRGGPAGIEHPFTRKVVPIGEDEDGEPITSLTIEFGTTAAPATSSDSRWTRSLGTLRRILLVLLPDAGEDVCPFAGGPLVRAVRIDLVRAEFHKQYVSPDGDRAKKMTASRQAFHRAVTAAKDRGLVAVREIDGTDFVWLATSAKP